MTDTQPFKDEARALLVKASVGTGRDVELLTQALHAAYQRGREESHAEMERLRWRHPCVIPEWGDLPQELRRRLVELGDCYTDESISGDFMLHVYEEMRTAIRTERDKG